MMPGAQAVAAEAAGAEAAGAEAAGAEAAGVAVAVVAVVGTAVVEQAAAVPAAVVLAVEAVGVLELEREREAQVVEADRAPADPVGESVAWAAGHRQAAWAQALRVQARLIRPTRVEPVATPIPRLETILQERKATRVTARTRSPVMRAEAEVVAVGAAVAVEVLVVGLAVAAELSAEAPASAVAILAPALQVAPAAVARVVGRPVRVASSAMA